MSRNIAFWRAAAFAVMAGLFLAPLFAEEAEEEHFASFGEDEGITIVETQETTQQMKVITRDEIETLNTDSLTTVLERLGGLSGNYYGGYGNTTSVGIRGFRSKQVAVLVDGVQINSKQDGQVDLDQIDPDSIEKIEIIYGASDTKYNVSNAAGGIINIVTVKKEKKGYSLGFGISNLSYIPGKYYEKDDERKNQSNARTLVDTQRLNFNFGLANEKISWKTRFFTTRAANEFTYKDFASPYTERLRDGNQVGDLGLNSSLLFDITDEMLLMLTGEYYGAQKDLPGSLSPYSIPGKQTDGDAGTSLFFSADDLALDGLDTEFTLAYRYNSLKYHDVSGVSKHYLNTVSAVNRWAYKLNDMLLFRLGWDWSYNNLDSTNSGLHSGNEGGAYATVELRPVDRFAVIPSIKIVSDGISVIPVPKLGLSFAATENLTLKNNYFRVFSFPSYEDLYWDDGYMFGDDSLLPEDGWGGDIGLNYNKRKYFTTDFSWYVTYYKDKIGWAPDDLGVWRCTNKDISFYTGANLNLTSDFSDKIILSAAYTWLLTYNLSDDYDFDDDVRMEYAPEHTLSMGVEFRWNNASLLVSEHYESIRSTASSATSAKLPAYFKTDISLNQKISPNVSGFVNLNNLFGESYWTQNNYPMPGFSIDLGIKAKLEGDF